MNDQPSENKEETKKKPKREKEFWELWFTNPEVYYFREKDQKEIILNPGWKKEWFRKNYPTGEVVLEKREYIPELPQNKRGKIIGMTGTPTIKNNEFKEIAERTSYVELSRQGLIRPKPIGTYYELFRGDDGYLQWICPKDYAKDGKNDSNRSTRRKNKAVPRPAFKNKVGFVTVERKQEPLAKSNDGNGNATGTEGKSS